jgi:hypothetical protein
MKSMPYSVFPSFSNLVGSTALDEHLGTFAQVLAGVLRQGAESLDAEKVGLLLLFTAGISPHPIDSEIKNSSAAAGFTMPNIGIAGKITDKLELVMAHSMASFAIGACSLAKPAPTCQEL